MQFSTGLITLALAVAGVSAAPGITERQDQAWGFTLLHAYELPDCKGQLLTSQQFVHQDQTSQVCYGGTIQGYNYQSWLVRYNELTRPLNVYSDAGCTGTVATIDGTTPTYTCFNQQIGSGQFA
ncbi:hypothetical protein HJFPF1_07661 [Paramyrothecium foliicola]|nr:hypothetical protein HJFPF1_07661 [Paramyrothecium foliicola]